MGDAFPQVKAWMDKAWRDLETARRAVTGQPSEYEEALKYAQTIYDFVIQLLPAEARP